MKLLAPLGTLLVLHLTNFVVGELVYARVTENTDETSLLDTRLVNHNDQYEILTKNVMNDKKHKKHRENTNLKGPNTIVSDDCLSLTVTFSSKDDFEMPFHLPHRCQGFAIDVRRVECGEENQSFPKTCRYFTIDERDEARKQLRLHYNIELDNVLEERKLLTTTAEVVGKQISLKSEEGHFVHNSGVRGSRDKQYQWVAQAMKKLAMAEKEGACKPKSKYKAGTRAVSCDWCSFWPCNCSCRGWKQVAGGMCVETCNGGYSDQIFPFCFQHCERKGQLSLNFGCGLTPADRTCVKDGGSCAFKYVELTISLAEVAGFFMSGGSYTIMKPGLVAATRLPKKSLFKKTFKEVTESVMNSVVGRVRKKLSNKMYAIPDKTKDIVIKGGAQLFFASSLNSDPDYGELALEIAEILDPTGLVGLTRQMIPPENCDEMVLMGDFPAEEKGLHPLDALHALDDDNTNIARGKHTSQSSTCWNGSSSRAVDGNTSGNYGGHSVTHTCNNDRNRWWKVNLGGYSEISKIVVWNRTDSCCTNRLNNVKVEILNNGNHVASHTINGGHRHNTINFSNKRGTEVKVSGGHDYLSLAEVEVFGSRV